MDWRRTQARAVITATRNELDRTLRIELEDAATRRAWVSTLGLLAGMMQQWHFVGLLGGEVRYESDTFSAPYSWGHLPLGRTMLPRDEWPRGWTRRWMGCAVRSRPMAGSSPGTASRHGRTTTG